MNTKSWVIVGICAVVMLVNINFWMGEDETSGSCMVPRMDDGTSVCLDYASSEKTNDFKQACKPLMRGTWSDEPCDRQGSLGGCQTGDNMMWFFPAGKFQSDSDVKDFCAGEDRQYLEPWYQGSPR